MKFTTPDIPTVKCISNNLPAARAGKLRVAWFAMGAAFGIACSSSLTSASLPQITHEPLVARTETPVEIEISETAAEDIRDQAQLVADTPGVPELAAVVAPTKEAVMYPMTKTLVVAEGDTFVTLLGQAGITIKDAHSILGAMGKKFNPRSIRVGDEVDVTIDKSGQDDAPYITNMSMALTNISSLEVTRDTTGNYAVKEVKVPVVKRVARAGGMIESSLYDTIVGNGMPSALVGEIIKAYSYDVDFQREIRKGHKIDVVFEQVETEDGKRVGHGNVLYASLQLGRRDLKIYHYTDAQGNSDYYTANGESVRKGLLRTPINGARISSSFGMRKHPILGYSRMHKGVDFAARTGTPIYAAGDGVVSYVGRKGAYGNYINIKHNGKYSSAYAHMHRFATGIASGKKVKQGQIIGYVGTTGRSTGPHLHYEIHANGRQVNPANVKFKTGTVLAGNELKQFKRSVETLHASLEKSNTTPGKLAMLDSKLFSSN